MNLKYLNLIQKLTNDIEEKIGDEIINIVSIREKIKENEEKANLITNTLDGLLEKYPDEESNIKNLIEDKFKNQFREVILSGGKRSDGRDTKDIREITIDPIFFARAHGSSCLLEVKPKLL